MGEALPAMAAKIVEQYEAIQALQAEIGKAVAAERERCAKIAEDALDPTEGARIAVEIRRT